MKESGPVSYAEACRLIDCAIADARLPSETIPVRSGLGRVLASPAISTLDLPPFNKSAMDGYAVSVGDDSAGFRIIGTIAAGQPPPAAPLGRGETLRVMTGAPVPPGEVEVVMQEDADVEGDSVRFRRRGQSNVCALGEDIRRGAEFLPAGKVLRPLDLANLIGCGVTEIKVARRPRIAVLTTGNELADDPAQIRPGRIMNSNGPLISSLAASFGFEVCAESIVADDLDVTREALRSALAEADMVLLSGGVSVGLFDMVPSALAQLNARVHFAGLSVKPGRPALFATVGGRAVFGLPGNPVSVFIMFHVLALRAAGKLTGAEFMPPVRSAVLAAPFARRRGDRLEFVPACLDSQGRAVALPSHGSAHLLALTRAEGLLMVPIGLTSAAEGAVMDFQPLPGGVA
ncbi:MAG TPA: molybdopterin molybdotransferase MoeA [Candidatus Brocadiia bacterium]|nr:molybdopterin molybdotransferase MoeA [Candidatus Brocadiia bacterium]